MRRGLLLLLCVGCGGDEDAPPTPDAAPIASPSLQAAPGLIRVADPSLPGFDGWPLPFVVSGGSRCRVTVGAAVLEACEAVWDGAGATPGAAIVSATLLDERGHTLAETQVTIHVVKVALTEVRLVSSERIPLLWPAAGGVSEAFWEEAADEPPWRIPAPVAINAPSPPIWDDLGTPPGAEEARNLPIAVTAGASISPEATVGGDLGAAEVRAIAPALAASPVLDRVDVPLAWSLEGRAPATDDGGGEWQAMPGTLTTTHRIYTLVGPPALGFASVPHRAWIDVIDTVTHWVGGTTADPLAVAGAVVEGVFYDLGLRYDNVEGASAYTWYPGDDFGGGQFALSAFRERRWGSTINCSDAASIVVTYAGMVGVDLRYHILTSRSADRFDLNYIEPIGFDVFDETPFVGDRGAFRYHAVVGPPASEAIFDATLALDGDGDPKSPPHAVLLPVDLAPPVYLEALSSDFDQIAVDYDEKVRLH